MDASIAPELSLSASPPSAAVAAGWQAWLRLRFAQEAGATVLRERRHAGPLRVQKALYPEGAPICHAIVIHPPGGIVGGDELAIEAQLGAGAHVVLSTPGAAKWYRANGRVSRQRVTLAGGAGARLEWLPQETIFFDQADVVLTHSVTLEGDAAYLSCEILCFGRTASGETFSGGQVRQSTTIRRDGRLIWFEQGRLAGAGAGMHSAFGLGGHTVCATVLAAGPHLSAPQLAELREALAALLAQENNGGAVGVTQLKSVLVVRYLGPSSQSARRLVLLAWAQLRPPIMGCAARVPRIWNT